MNSRGDSRLTAFARLSGAILLLLLWPGLAAAGEEKEIGTWGCLFAYWGSCAPDGLGRGPEDFWTYPGIGQDAKVRVSCKITNTSWTEECNGRYYIAVHGLWGSTFGARLTCPEGYLVNFDQCVEINPPRSDKNCPLPAGSPVDAVTGVNAQTVIDWGSQPPAARASTPLAAGRMPELRRHYSSQFDGLYTPFPSRLGNGWRTNFDALTYWVGDLATAWAIHVQLPDAGEITYILENGVWKPKIPAQIYSYFMLWDRPRTDVTTTLTANATTVTLRKADGTRYVFNSKGQLWQIIAPDGYTQTLTYTGQLHTRVTDSRGGWINLIYGPEGSAWAGLLVVAQFSDGALIRYSYEDRSQAGRKVKYSQTTGTNQWALKTVTYPDTTPSIIDNPRTVYEYLDNMYRPYLIATATNRPSPQPTTWSTTKWTYDVKKRVTSVERSIGKERWAYNYDDAKQQVTVTDPQRRNYTYARQISSEGLTKLRLLTFSRTSLPRSSPTPAPAPTARSPIDDLICKLTGKCSCPVDQKERCKVVTDYCIESCVLAYDNVALQDLQSMYFQRCLAQCRFDYECPGGIDYPDDGWDQGKIGTPRPWLGK